MPKRVVVVGAIAVVVAIAAWFVLRPETGVPGDAPTENEMAEAVGTEVMQHLYLGHVPGRSGEVLMVPKPHHFLISKWDMTQLAGPTLPLGSTHPNPWSYLTRVPIVAHGAGVTPGVVEQPVDIAAIAPTYAEILGMTDFRAEADPQFLDAPTVSEIWDVSNANRPIV
ncbi:MAG TPA: hypothetical protein VEV43_09815, partial [Actinomycetota bacterium]|nr:hypothetical protein [Actinomycetota bacterium]